MRAFWPRPVLKASFQERLESSKARYRAGGSGSSRCEKRVVADMKHLPRGIHGSLGR
jgi:hypothetical protein